MDYNLTAVYRRVPEGYVAFVEELPGANTQGATLEQARTNLREAVELVIEETARSQKRVLTTPNCYGLDLHPRGSQR